MAGAHVIKCGLNPVVIELIKKKVITCICLNGAGIINDFEIAFQGSARVLKQSDDLGAISAGRLADIVLLRQDSPHNLPHINPAANLIYSTNASDVDTVLCNGRVLKRGGSLLTIDMPEVKRQISKRIARLSERAPAGRRMATYPTI